MAERMTESLVSLPASQVQLQMLPAVQIPLQEPDPSQQEPDPPLEIRVRRRRLTRHCFCSRHLQLLPVLGAIDFSTYREGQEAPLVPWQLVWLLDWGWFVLLGLTVVFLPDAPELQVCHPRPGYGHAPALRRHIILLVLGRCMALG